MTTAVVTQLAALLGDDIDHARYLWRDGDRYTKYPPRRMWCDRMRERKAS